MISDGVMHLHEAGKVTNRKPLHDGLTVATFALGSQKLYRWLDGNPSVRILPVTDVNESWVLRQLPRLTSINGALSIDLAGQVAADSVGGRQYSGTGGHESFVSGRRGGAGGAELSLPQVDGEGRRQARVDHRARVGRRHARHHAAPSRAIRGHGIRCGRHVDAQ